MIEHSRLLLQFKRIIQAQQAEIVQLCEQHQKLVESITDNERTVYIAEEVVIEIAKGSRPQVKITAKPGWELTHGFYDPKVEGMGIVLLRQVVVESREVQ